MRVVLLGPFKIPGSTGLMARVKSPAPVGSGLVYDAHTSRMATLRPQAVSTTTQSPWGPIELLEGSTEFGTIRIELDVPDREALHAVEPELETHANALLQSYYGAGSAESHGYPAGSVLWWHRVLLAPGKDAPRAIRIFGESFQATDEVSGCVADGFTTLDSTAESLVREVEHGLIAATEDWLLIDDLSRRLTRILIDSNADDEVLGATLTQAEGLTEEIALAVLLMDERVRHLANGSARTHDAATAVWKIGEVRESLLRNAESVQSLIRVEHGRRGARFDSRRNSILFGFTAVTVLQSILLVIDFGTAPRLGLESITRLCVAVLVLVLTIGILIRYMREGAGDEALGSIEPAIRTPTRIRRDRR